MTELLFTALASIMICCSDDRLDAAYNLLLDGNGEAALVIYEEILEEDPKQLKALEMAGYILYKGFYFTEAEVLYQRALDIEKDGFQSYLMLGNIALHRFQPVEALQFYSQALEIQPDDEVLLGNMALAREKIERAGKLMRHYRKATWIYWCGVAAGLAAVLGFVLLEIRSALGTNRKEPAP